MGHDREADNVLNAFTDLTPFEVEHFIGELEMFKLEDVGASRWLSQHERIEKLNWTAHSQAHDLSMPLRHIPNVDGSRLILGFAQGEQQQAPNRTRSPISQIVSERGQRLGRD